MQEVNRSLHEHVMNDQSKYTRKRLLSINNLNTEFKKIEERRTKGIYWLLHIFILIHIYEYYIIL